MIYEINSFRGICVCFQNLNNNQCPLSHNHGNAHVRVHLFHFRGFTPVQKIKCATTVSHNAEDNKIKRNKYSLTLSNYSFFIIFFCTSLHQHEAHNTMNPVRWTFSLLGCRRNRHFLANKLDREQVLCICIPFRMWLLVSHENYFRFVSPLLLFFFFRRAFYFWCGTPHVHYFLYKQTGHIDLW